VLGDRGERNAHRIRRHREAPEHVAELLDHLRIAGLAMLEHFFSHEAEDFRGLLGEPRARVEESIARVESRVDGAQSRLLVFVEMHGGHS
jgi:hypothetical protein